MSTKAVQVLEWGQGPQLVIAPPPPKPSSTSVTKIQVIAVGIHNLVRARASGSHYTSTASLPHTPGVDGVGIDTSTGKRVYFHTFTTPNTGTLQEIVYVHPEAIAEVPQGLSSIHAAALINPALSSWMALSTRVQLEKGWTCLILGATSMSGRVAVRVAKQFGAVEVYGAGRSEERLQKVEGLDGYVVLNEKKPEDTQWKDAKDATVVLDYLYDQWPGVYLPLGKKPVQWISIGTMAGAQASIPGQILRSRDVTLRGSAPGSWAPEKMNEEALKGMLGVLEGFDDGGEVRGYGVGDVGRVWGNKGERVVLTFEIGG